MLSAAIAVFPLVLGSAHAADGSAGRPEARSGRVSDEPGWRRVEIDRPRGEERMIVRRRAMQDTAPGWRRVQLQDDRTQRRAPPASDWPAGAGFGAGW